MGHVIGQTRRDLIGIAHLPAVVDLEPLPEPPPDTAPMVAPGDAGAEGEFLGGVLIVVVAAQIPVDRRFAGGHGLGPLTGLAAVEIEEGGGFFAPLAPAQLPQASGQRRFGAEIIVLERAAPELQRLRGPVAMPPQPHHINPSNCRAWARSGRRLIS